MATDFSAMDVTTRLQSLAVQVPLWGFQEVAGHLTELSEENAAMACCFEMERDTELRVVQGLGDVRVETPQRNGDIVQIGIYKSVPSLSCDLGFVVIDPVIFFNFTFLSLSVIVSATLNLAEHLFSNVFKKRFGDAMEQAHIRGGYIASATSTGSATGGGKGRQRTRSAPAIGRGVGHSVVSQRGRTERVDRHRLQNLSCPLRGARGRGNGRSRAVLSRRSGRHQGQTRGRTRRGSRTTRSPVRAHVGGVLAQLGGNGSWRQSTFRR